MVAIVQLLPVRAARLGIPFFFLPSLPVRARAARRSLLPSTDHKSDYERGENGIPEKYIVTNSRERKLVCSSAYIFCSKERHIGARPCEFAKVGGRKRETEIEKDRDTGQIERAKTPRGTAQLDRGRRSGEIRDRVKV